MCCFFFFFFFSSRRRHTRSLCDWSPDVCSSDLDGGLDFWALQQRLHPAASRVNMLAEKTPASFVAFDLLALGDGDLTAAPFAERRAALERALQDASPPVHVTPITRDIDVARGW